MPQGNPLTFGFTAVHVTGKCEYAELVLKVQLVPQPLKLIYAKLKRCGIGDTSIFFVIIHK